MKMRRVLKDEKVSMPLSVLGEGSGFSSVPAPEDGLRIKLRPDEFEVVFVSDSELKKLGYHYRNPPKSRMKKEVKKAHVK